MRATTRTIGLGAALLLSACGPRGGASAPDLATPPAPADFATTPDLGMSGDLAQLVAATVQLGDYVAQKAVAGATVCTWPDAASCAKTSAAGYALLHLPPDSDVALAIDATPTYEKTLLTLHTASTSFSLGYAFAPAAQRAADAQGFYALDDTHGSLSVQVGTTTAGLAGAVLALSPQAGKGPFYQDTSGKPDGSLTATTARGAADWGELPPGNYQVTVTTPPTGYTCASGTVSWAGSTAGSLALPVAAGYRTAAAFVCN